MHALSALARFLPHTPFCTGDDDTVTKPALLQVSSDWQQIQKSTEWKTADETSGWESK
ncbi:MAG TPA: hypothetical protein VF450_08930 [Noviherbaspirillum sp.]